MNKILKGGGGALGLTVHIINRLKYVMYTHVGYSSIVVYNTCSYSCQ